MMIGSQNKRRKNPSPLPLYWGGRNYVPPAPYIETLIYAPLWQCFWRKFCTAVFRFRLDWWAPGDKNTRWQWQRLVLHSILWRIGSKDLYCGKYGYDVFMRCQSQQCIKANSQCHRYSKQHRCRGWFTTLAKSRWCHKCKILADKTRRIIFYWIDSTIWPYLRSLSYRYAIAKIHIKWTWKTS